MHAPETLQDSPAGESGTPTRLLDPRIRRATIAIWSIMGLASFEGLAVAAGLPDVAGDLGRVDLLPWVIVSYLLTSGVATVVAGPMVDGLGVRAVFRYAVVLFTLAGTVAAFAPSMQLLIVARVVQGVGAGLVTAVALAAVSLVIPAPLVGRAYASNANVWAVMGIAGPGIAAVMLTVLSWRWIFGINLPLGIFALAVGWNAFPGRAEGASMRFDLRGTVLVGTFTLALLMAVDSLSVLSIVWAAVAVGAVVIYRWHATTRPDPVLEPRHLAGAPFGLLGISIAALLIGALASTSYIPLYVRAGRGGGTALTAWSVIFFVLGWTAGANLSSRLLDRMTFRAVISRGFGFAVPGLTIMAVGAALNLPLPFIFAGAIMAGAGTGMSTNVGLTLMREITEDAEIGRALAAHQFMRNQGFAIGAALGGAVLLVVVGNAIGDVELVRELLVSGNDTGPVDPAVAAAVRAGFATSVGLAAVIAALGFIPFSALRRWLEAREQRLAAAESA